MNNFGLKFYKKFLKVFIKKLKKRMKKKLISCVLYGSIARGEAKAYSDIDLLILYEGSHLETSKIYAKTVNESRRTEEYKKFIEMGIYPEISPYFLTVEELRENPLILLDIMEEGIVLMDRGKTFDKLVKKFKKITKELGSRKVFLKDGSWYWELKPDWKLGEELEIKI